MYDNGKIQSYEFWEFSHLTQDFFTARENLFERFYNPYCYKLWNINAQKGKYYIKVEAYLDGNSRFLRITGSLRKWFFGEKSLEDFTKLDFVKALKLLSGYLEIPYKKLLMFKLSKIEIGCNIRLKVTVAPFLSMIAGFSSTSYKRRQEEGWRHFRTDQFKATLYDKVAEINKKKCKRILINEIEENKQSFNYLNFMRIEFTIMKGKSVLERKLGFNTLYDFVENFQDLYKFFWNQCQKFQLLEDFPLGRIPMSNSWGDLKKVIFEESVREKGYDRIMDICSYLEGKVRRDARAELRKIFNFSKNDSESKNKYLLLRAIRVSLMLHLIKSGWAKESSKIIPQVNYNIRKIEPETVKCKNNN